LTRGAPAAGGEFEAQASCTMPVVWATEVLESLRKKGPSRVAR